MESRCNYTDDYVVCDNESYYLRCLIPLPVQNTERDYSLGVWVQVSPESFRKVWDLWDDEDQSEEPPIKGLLANSVHLNSRTKNAEVTVQLTGPTSRPTVSVQYTDCTLYKEQRNGITIHRASEYSDLCR